MSTHKVEVVPVVLKPHPNADSLSIVEIYGWTVCARTEDWVGKDRGAYIPPDSLVDTTRPEFAWLATPGRTQERIKVKKLRGVVSMGLLIPTDAPIGSDVMEQLGVKHYEPPMKGEPGTPKGPSLEAGPGPSAYAPSYDVENARRYGKVVFTEGEPVIVTEKIHGANGRWLFDGEKLHCGSRSEWKREGVGFPWTALEACPWLRDWLMAHPNLVVYGEVFGQVQDLKYDRKLDVAVFDILHGSTWLNADEARILGAGLQWVPELARTIWSWPAIAEYAEGKSMLADHVREGCVIKPLVERTCLEIGRVQAKIVGNGYLERA